MMNVIKNRRDTVLVLLLLAVLFAITMGMTLVVDR